MSLIAVFLFILCFSEMPTPIIDRHFMSPVLTGMPKIEQINKERYAPISEQNAFLSVIFIILFPNKFKIFLPQNRVPIERINPTDNDKNIGFSSLKLILKRKQRTPKYFIPPWYPCINELSMQDKICSILYGNFFVKILIVKKLIKKAKKQEKTPKTNTSPSFFNELASFDKQNTAPLMAESIAWLSLVGMPKKDIKTPKIIMQKREMQTT